MNHLHHWLFALFFVVIACSKQDLATPIKGNPLPEAPKSPTTAPSNNELPTVTPPATPPSQPQTPVQPTASEELAPFSVEFSQDFVDILKSDSYSNNGFLPQENCAQLIYKKGSDGSSIGVVRFAGNSCPTGGQIISKSEMAFEFGYKITGTTWTWTFPFFAVTSDIVDGEMSIGQFTSSGSTLTINNLCTNDYMDHCHLNIDSNGLFHSWYTIDY